MLDIAATTIRDQLVGRVRPGAPYRDYFTKAIETAFNVTERFETERNRILKDGRLSEDGKRADVVALVRDRFAPELARGPGKTARHAAQRNASRKTAIGRPTFDKGDLAAGLERREVRDYVRSQPEGQRLQVAVELVKDKKLAQALLSGPSPVLTGLRGPQFEELHRIYLQTHYADQLADVEAERDDIEAVAAAVEVARTKLRGASGQIAHAFDQDWTALEKKVDGE